MHLVIVLLSIMISAIPSYQLTRTSKFLYHSVSYSSLRKLMIGLPVGSRSITRCFMTTSESDTIPSVPLCYGKTRDLMTNTLTNTIKECYPSFELTTEPFCIPTRQEFGDYQSNVAMVISKQLKLKPIDLANVLRLKLLDGSNSGFLEDVSISGPGFLNFKLTSNYVKYRIIKMLQDNKRLGIPKISEASKVIVDFSSPNIAKEMHVGHLRSTIIGDCISRVLEFLGHDVLRLNHVGDWGTQFGMLVHYLQSRYPESARKYRELQNSPTNSGNIDALLDTGIKDLVQFYKAAKKVFDEDAEFKEASKNEVVKLQSGNEDSLSIWRAICQQSRNEFQMIYDILKVKVNERGESFYNPYLESIVQDLTASDIAVESEGATCIFVPGYFNQDGSPMPLIIKKSDGAYLYATTDLAALKHRVQVENAGRIIYVTDDGQAPHFDMVFKAARMAKLTRDDTKLVHVPFGVVQGHDGKKLKSRSGETIKLKDLLDEAVAIAKKDILSRKSKSLLEEGSIPEDKVDSVELSPEESKTAEVVGISAVKYADLSMNRESAYRFDYNKMLSLNGNTAPYMLYAYVRIRGIQRRAAETLELEQPNLNSKDIFTIPISSVSDLNLSTSEEISLAKQLLLWDEVLLEVSRDLYPNKVCINFSFY